MWEEHAKEGGSVSKGKECESTLIVPRNCATVHCDLNKDNIGGRN